MVGASGAIAAVMGGYLLLFPKARVDVLLFFIIIIRVIPGRAWMMLGVWFALQLIGGYRETRRRAASPTGPMPAASSRGFC